MFLVPFSVIKADQLCHAEIKHAKFLKFIVRNKWNSQYFFLLIKTWLDFEILPLGDLIIHTPPNLFLTPQKYLEKPNLILKILDR